MNNKQRLLSTFGTICFITGALLLLGVLLVWKLAPIFVPPNYSSANHNNFSDQDLASLAQGPALSPFIAQDATSNAVQTLLPSPSEPIVQPPSTANETDAFSGTTDWSVITYPESNRGKIAEVVTQGHEMRVTIPAIGVDAPVQAVGLYSSAVQDGRSHQQWTVPDDYAAGWHESSAPPGQPGNTVLNGHNNIHGAIFHDLVDVPLGAEIIISTSDQSHVYEVTGREFLMEQGEPLRNRLRNARWILPTEDERITIVTCWPNSSNSHRLVVVAQPVEKS